MGLHNHHQQCHVGPEELQELKLVVPLFQIHYKENESFKSKIWSTM